MNLIQRYVRNVQRYLPVADRADIGAELAANLAEEIEDRARELGRPLDEAECLALLDAHGHPLLVAQRFGRSSNAFVFGPLAIGPALFPYYVRVLALNLAVACLVAIVAAFTAIPTWTGIPNVLAHVVLQSAIVTAAFVAIQWYADRGTSWLPRHPASETQFPKRRVSRLESISTLVWFVGSNVWLADFALSRNLFVPEPGSTLVLAPVWQHIAIPYAVIVAFEIVRNGVNLVRPGMVRFRAAMIAAASAVSAITIVMLLAAGPPVLPARSNDLGDIALADAVGRAITIGFVLMAAGVPLAIAWQIRTLVALRASVAFALALCTLGLATQGFPPTSDAATLRDLPPAAFATCGVAVAPLATDQGTPQWNGWAART